MSIRIKYSKSQLKYIKPARTSRGEYTYRDFILLEMYDTQKPGIIAYGECSYLPDLSCDVCSNYEDILQEAIAYIEENACINTEYLRNFPSILMGLETVLLSYQSQSYALNDTSFSRGEKGIPINGLIWMSDFQTMCQQIEYKLEAGFRCIKIKIGSIDFEDELALLRKIRNKYPASKIQLRVDANGSFAVEDALDKIKQLAQFDLHSIEQPIKQHHWKSLSLLCQESPLPIALDEELIGVNTLNGKATLLDTIMPQYIVLKPSLHGGFSGCREWIELAEERSIGWWITSALETNIGLNAIAHFTAQIAEERLIPIDELMHQGLGTGQLFVENFDTPLLIKGEQLWFNVERIEKHTKLQCSVDDFWNHWENDRLKVYTSGSTGKPKELILNKEKMLASAERTLKALSLDFPACYYLCLPLQYIAGQMMMVRALYSHSKIIVAEANTCVLNQLPLFIPTKIKIDFIAITPLMLVGILNDPIQKERLKKISTVLVGGGAIPKKVEDQLQSFPNDFWASYGMTETLSNIALRPLNGKNRSEYFTPLEGVSLSTKENCLEIMDILILGEPIQTFDSINLLPDKRFKVIGRVDNVINSGGLKIQPEEIERKLEHIFSCKFVVSSIPDLRLGEKLVLVTEYSIDITKCNELPRLEQPLDNVVVAQLPLTETGKIARFELKKNLHNLYKLK